MKTHKLIVLVIAFIGVSSSAMEMVPYLEDLRELALICTPPQVRKIDDAIQGIQEDPNDSAALLHAAEQLARIGVSHLTGGHYTDIQMIEYMRQVVNDLFDRASQLSA